MSQPPKKRPPVRRVVSEEEYAPPPPPPRNRNRSAGNTGNAGNRYASNRPPQRQGGSRPRGREDYYYPQRRTDPFPIIIGAMVLVLVLGLLFLVYLFTSNRNGSVATPNTPVPGAASQPTTAPAAQSGTEAPRMPLADFMALYNDPAKRPLIIDVRAKDAYDAGHIAGAVSFPEADVDTRYQELPKDKLVVAYCQ